LSTTLAWTLLVVAGLFEVAWAIGLKYTEGFTKPVPTVLTVAAMVISMGLLGVVARQLPIGTAYAVWTGIGAAGTALLGIWLFGEAATVLRLLCLTLIVAGVIGLKLGAQA
jgi:quaternary ammonium compound-resistance protein SugE